VQTDAALAQSATGVPAEKESHFGFQVITHHQNTLLLPFIQFSGYKFYALDGFL